MTGCSPFSGTSGIGGAFTYDAAKGDLTVKGGRTATLAAGTYCLHNLTVGGGSSLVTASSAPADLKIRSSYTGGGGVSLGGGGAAYAAIYAPTTGITVAGGSVVFGSLLGKTLNIGGDSAVHYDTH